MTKKINTLLLIIMMIMSGAFAAMAVPAKPGWQTIEQSDGTMLKVKAVGNSYSSAIVTSDGLTVARGSDGDFYYLSSLTGLSTVRAHEAALRTPAESAFVNAQRSQLTMQRRQRPVWRRQGMLGVGGSNAETGVPALGQRRIPIILVEFKDKKFNNTREEIIESMLTGNESVGQYFRDQSNGLYQPEFDVYGIYGLSQDREYYGGHEGDSNDKGLGWLVTEACQLASADGVTFNTYDTNDDDYCDVVIVIYAGVGEAQAYWNYPESVWPCNWDLNSAAYYSEGGDGQFRPADSDPYVNVFAVFNELYGSNDNGKTIDGIGTFTHEFGHCLGLPDFYDTGDGGHYGLGDWDIMCLGCYNNDGFTPPGYSAYEKVFMGWMDYITPHPGTYYTLPVFNQKSLDTDKAVCITSDLNRNEYFILENRKRQGWDRYMPGEGIMITHVTYDADRWWGNTPNNENIQLMTLMPADNDLSYANEGTDLWPQGSNNAFTDSSTPAARLNMTSKGVISGRAGYLGKPVTDMAINSDGTASFWYMKDAVTDPVISVTASEVDFGGVMTGTALTRTIRVIGQALQGDVTLSVADGNGIFTAQPTVITAAQAANGCDVRVTFAPQAISDYATALTLKSEGAQDVVINLRGHGLIEGYAPVMLPADQNAIGLTRFRADWTDQTPGQNVDSYTLEVKVRPEFDLLESADFSSVPDALDNGYLADISGDTEGYLPSGWSCTSPLYAYDGYLISSAIIRTPEYNLTGYGKVTIVLKACSYYQSYYGAAVVQVSTSKGQQTLTLGEDFEDYTLVLDGDETDMVTIKTTQNMMALKAVQVYAGQQVSTIRATESGDDLYRLITGIQGLSYTVDGLQSGGSYIYKVKTIFADGTESAWSNTMPVVLAGHDYKRGDVNHDGVVSIDDVTALIDYLLRGGGDACVICADMDGSGSVTIDDVTALIDRLLRGE